MKKLYLLSGLFMGVAAMTSCSDFLESENKSDIDSDTYFYTETGFENLSSTPYYKLRNIYGGDPVLFCSGTDMYEKGRSNYSDATLSTYKDLITSNSNVLSFYQNCYDGIQQCNNVISYGAGASGSNVKHRVDEAKTLKAFYYYLLVQQFGAVPVSETPITSVALNFPRKSVSDVYEYIISLLKEVESNGVLEMNDGYTGRVTMRFVYNLLAKTYLAYGWDVDVTASDYGYAEGEAATVADKSKFQLAAEYADKAIDGATPSYSFSDFWDVKNDNNEDVIFAIQYTRDISGQDETTTGNKQDAQFSNYYNDDNNEMTKYTSSQYPASEKLIYLFEPGDDRFEGTFMVEQRQQYKSFYAGTKYSVADDATVYYGYYPAWYTDLSTLSTYNASSTGRVATKVFSTSNPSVGINAVEGRGGRITYKSVSQTYETSRISTGQSICVRKFDDYTATRNGTSAVSFHNIILAHLTETYLVAAEAYYMAGNTANALSRLNVVRKRSNATELSDFASYKRHYSDGTANSYNSGSGIDNVPYISGSNLDPIDIILDERARELVGEYHRWMDLRRTKRLIDYNVKYNSGVTDASMMMGKDGKYRWYRPFPDDEINVNSALTSADQTDGYK